MERCVAITGVSKGLGRALVDTFDQKGWTVFGCARSKKIIEEMTQVLDKRHRFSALDITSYEAVEKWSQSLSQFSIDILINNASIVNQPKHLWEISPQEFQETLQVNLGGVFNSLRCFVPSMIRQKKGVFASISSDWGKSADAQVGPYCASKFGLEGMMQSLALELPQGLISLSIDPGIMKTKMLEKCQPPSVYQKAQTPQYIAEKVVRKLTHLKPSDSGSRVVIS